MRNLLSDRRSDPGCVCRRTRPIVFAWLVSALGFLLVPVASADPTASAPGWALPCELEGSRFVLRFHSPSGDVLSDDMQVSLEPKGGPTIEMDLDPAWFKPVQLRHRLRSACEGSDGFELSPGRVLVLFSADRRPGLDALVAVVVDAARGRIIGDPQTLGELTGDARLRRRKGGIEVELVQGYLGSAELEETPSLGWRRIRATADGLRID
jgi:hypothetical protein